MKLVITLAVATGLFTTLAWSAEHGDSASKSNVSAKTEKAEKSPELPICPVMGEPVNFRISTMTEEGPVYFCCPMCIKKFNDDPEKYAKGAKEQREQLAKRERIQVNCPLTGKPIDKKVFTGEGKDRVYFCCEDCKAKYEKEPAKYAAKLAASYTYQTHCPVMGGEINPTVFTDLPSGERVYYCCPGCDKELMEAPDKYAAKLEEQGTPIDVAKLKKAIKAAKKS